MPEPNENTPVENSTTETAPDTTAPDYKAEAVAALGAWISEGEMRLSALSHVPGHVALGSARSAFECALTTLRADLGIVGGKH